MEIDVRHGATRISGVAVAGPRCGVQTAPIRAKTAPAARAEGQTIAADGGLPSAFIGGTRTTARLRG